MDLHHQPFFPSKEDAYQYLKKVVRDLLKNETNLIANLANTVAILKETFGYFWIGFYLVDINDLVLGPFQGPMACTRIPYSKGVCGKAWELDNAIVAPNVNEFPGHIACNSLSKSEIVVPIKINNKIIGVLDIDSIQYNEFDEVDKKNLEEIVALYNEIL